MEIQEVIILLVLAVVSSLATRMVYEQTNLQSREGFADETAKIPIQNILKHIHMAFAISPKNDTNYWEAADQPSEAIYIKGLRRGVSFKSLRIENIEGYRPGLLLCESADCATNGRSWGVYMPPKNITDRSIDFVHHVNGYIGAGSTKSQIEREFREPGLSISLNPPHIVKPYTPTIESPTQSSLSVAPVSVPQVPECPTKGEVRIWNGVCMSQSRMENEFKYWTIPHRVAEFKKKGQYYSNVVPNLKKLNDSYKRLTGQPYKITIPA
jgi:hypothetical protein